MMLKCYSFSFLTDFYLIQLINGTFGNIIQYNYFYLNSGKAFRGKIVKIN